MKTIRAYQLDSPVNLTLPKNAEILTIKVVNGTPVLYASVDERNGPVHRRITSRKAGQETPDAGKYICSVILDWTEVLHYFDLGEAIPRDNSW